MYSTYTYIQSLFTHKTPAERNKERERERLDDGEMLIVEVPAAAAAFAVPYKALVKGSKDVYKIEKSSEEMRNKEPCIYKDARTYRVRRMAVRCAFDFHFLTTCGPQVSQQQLSLISPRSLNRSSFGSRREGGRSLQTSTVLGPGSLGYPLFMMMLNSLPVSAIVSIELHSGERDSSLLNRERGKCAIKASLL